MTNDPFPQRFRELNWRRKLSAEEEAQLRAWLAAHPDDLTDWEAETRLTEVLTRLPDAPVASNFTARVLQAVSLEEEKAARIRRQRKFGWRWFTRLGWAPKTAVALVVLSGGLVYRYHAIATNRIAVAKSVEVISSGVEVVSRGASLPSADILQDFDAIRALNQAPAADEQLLTLLQ